MSEARSRQSHLRGLNPEQRRAVLHTEGPLLVLAGAGSGKTRTLVHRIVHLIRGHDVPPSRIVAVTFTNRAAEEMRERVRAFAPDQARSVVVSTFHALGARILREHGERLGLPRRFAIYSTADQLAALRSATAEVSIDDDSFDLKRVLRQISDWKSRGLVPAAATAEVAAGPARGDRSDDYAVLAAGAYARYDEVLRASGAVDFDDLLLLPLRLLSEDEDIRRALWKRWHYFLVDEYQDTNGVQLELARLLAGSRRNLCVVGDDDQSIYAFRGADVSNILEFERHFPGAAVVTLEQNYRSTRRILEAANAVIAGNPHRHAKRLRTDNGVGALIDYFEHEDEAAEAEAIATEITLRRFTRKLRWGEIAVLYRTNTQARPLEEALREKNVPYRVLGGTSFFDRKEVADALAYLRVAANPSDEIALRRIINYPQRGIGRTTVLKVAERAATDRAAFARTLWHTDEALVGTAQARAIAAFLQILDHARHGLHAAETQAARTPFTSGLPPLAHWAEGLFSRLGLEDAIRADPRNARSAPVRLDNLRDLVGSIARYERKTWAEAAELATTAGVGIEGVGGEALAAAAEAASAGAWTPPTLSGALSRLALAGLDDDAEEAEDGDATVALMTLHSAKGLEFSDVFIVGLEEGILPHARSLDAAADGVDADPLSEERRLLYVGITRARQRLALSLCRARKGREVVLPSRYLGEIPPELLNVRAAEIALPPDESAALRAGFFQQMKTMFGEERER